MTQLIIQPSTAENAKKLVSSALENGLRIIKFGINKTLNQLKVFEKKFGTDSPEFYRKFNAGDMGDDFEYITHVTQLKKIWFFNEFCGNDKIIWSF